MWREQEDGTMIERKICPVMSDSRGMVLCQGRNCAAAYSRELMAGTFWCCRIIEGYPPNGGGHER